MKKQPPEVLYKKGAYGKNISERLLLVVHLRRCKIQQIYTERSLLLRANIFFLLNTLFWRNTSFDQIMFLVWCIKRRTCLFKYSSPIVSFPNSSVRIGPIKLKAGIVYHMQGRRHAFEKREWGTESLKKCPPPWLGYGEHFEIYKL